MKKLIIFLLVLFSCVSAISQPITQRSSQTITVMDARSGATFNMLIPRYEDTVQASMPGAIGLDTCGAIIFTYSNNACWFRQCSPKKWVLFGSTNGNNGSDTLFAELPLFFDSTTRSPSTIIKFLRGNGIVSGGTVTVDSCRTLDVPPTVLNMNYKTYTSVATVLTVPVSDPSNPRTDEVIMDTFGIVSLLVGTPAATPVGVPINPASQFILASYTIAAGASCLDVTQIIVWDENVGSPNEFVLSTSGTISSNGNNTDNPFHLTKAIFVSTYTNGSSLIFTSSTPLVAQATEIFKFWVYSNGVFGNQFQIQFFNGSTPIGNPISFNTGFGFNPNDSNQYQQVVIPFSAFNITTQTYDKVVITFAGNDISGAKGLYLDYLQLQQGNSNPSTQLILTTVGSSGASSYDPTTNVLNIPIYSGGGGGDALANFYLKDSSLSSDRTVNLEDKILIIGSEAGLVLTLNPIANTIDYTAATHTITSTGSNTTSLVVDNASILSSVDDGVNEAAISVAPEFIDISSGQHGSIDYIGEIQVVDSTIRLKGYGLGTLQNEILVDPNLIAFRGINSIGNIKSKVLFEATDTLLTTPTYVYVPDNDTMKVYPFVGSITTFQWSVLDSLSTPVVSPSQGNPYLVGTAPTGAFTGHANQIAIYDTTSGYSFNTATVGDLLYNATTQEVSEWTGTAWVRVTVNNYVHITGVETILGKKSFADTLNLLAKPIQIITTPNIPVSLLTTRSAGVSFPWLLIEGNSSGSKIIMGANNPASADDELRIVADYTDSIWTGTYRPLIVDVYENLKFNVNRGGTNDTVISFSTFGNNYMGVFHNTGQFALSQYGSGTFTGTATTCPAFDADGNIIEVVCGGGGGTVTSVSGTTNRITSTGGATPVINISAAYVGQTSLTTLGTVTTGTLSTGAVIGGVTMTLGSDAQGDLYYRNGSGVLTRLAAGTSNQILHSGTTPSWKDTAAAGGAAWNLTGNAGTSASTNFIGTTDNNAMVFKQNNIYRMQVDTGNRSTLFIGNFPGNTAAGNQSILVWDTLRSNVTFPAAGAGNPFYIGLNVVKQVYKLTGDTTVGTIMGAAFEPRYGPSNTGNWTTSVPGLNMVGVRASTNIQIGATGTSAIVTSIYAGGDYGGMTLTNRYGAYIDNPSMHDGNAITRNYSLYIANQVNTASINYGLYSATSNNMIIPATQLQDSYGGLTVSAFEVDATQAQTPVGNQWGVNYQITSAGSTSNENAAFNSSYLPGYTGSGPTSGIKTRNTAVGTGANITGINHNSGIFSAAVSTTAGTNLGSDAWASGGNINIGSLGQTIVAKNSAKNIGGMFLGNNSGTSPVEVGAYIGNNSSDPTITTSAALMIDNAAEAVNIVTFRDNGSIVAAMVDGGALAIGASTATDKLEVTGNIALMTAGNKIKIATGTNASIGVATLVGGTVTVSTTAVTAASIIMLTDATTGVLTNIGTPTVGTIVAGTSFVINSSNVLDTSAVNWHIIN